MQELFGFVLAGFALAGSPGPATLSLAAAGAAFGPRRGIRYMAGIGLGMLAVMTITASGVTGVLLAVPGATPVVTVAAAAYFIYLAWRIATAPPLAEAAGERREPGIAAGAMLSLVNPKGYAAMAALFSAFTLIPDGALPDAAAKIAVLTAVIATVNLAWLLAGAAMTRLFREPRANRIVNVSFAVLLLASLAAALAV